MTIRSKTWMKRLDYLEAATGWFSKPVTSERPPGMGKRLANA